jgi:hypothetical protein
MVNVASSSYWLERFHKRSRIALPQSVNCHEQEQGRKGYNLALERFTIPYTEATNVFVVFPRGKPDN